MYTLSILSVQIYKFFYCMNKSTKIAILASGSGSNAENIINYFSDHYNVNIDCILCNKKDAFVFKRAEKLNIDAFYFDKTAFSEPKNIIKLLKERAIDYIILAGFLLKIPESIIHQYPNEIINIHPALLPNYGGKGMYGMNVHRAIIENKESESGITIHLVNEEYDKGKILFQAKTIIEEQDSPEDLAQKIHQLEYKHFPEIIKKYIEENA